MKKWLLVLILLLSACSKDEEVIDTPKDQDTPKEEVVPDEKQDVLYESRMLVLEGINPDNLIIIDNDFDEIFTVLKDGVEVDTNGYALVLPVGDGTYLARNEMGQYGIVDSNFNEIIEVKYQEVLPLSFGTAPAMMNNLWGVVNQNGVVIDFQYEYVFPSVVEDTYLVHSNAMDAYFVNDKNEKISDSFWLKAINTSIGWEKMKDIDYVSNEHETVNDEIEFISIMVQIDDSMAVYGFDGNVIIPPIYDYITYHHDTDMYTADIYDGFFYVETIFFNGKGEELYRVNNEVINQFSEGILRFDNAYYDTEFNEVYVSSYWSSEDVVNGNIIVYGNDAKAGIATFDGLLVDPVYDRMSEHNGYYNAQMGFENYIINSNGVVISAGYEVLSSMERGYATFWDDTNGVINASGEEVLVLEDYEPFYARETGVLAYNPSTYNVNLFVNGEKYSDMDFHTYYTDLYIFNRLFGEVNMALFASDGLW